KKKAYLFETKPRNLRGVVEESRQRRKEQDICAFALICDSIEVKKTWRRIRRQRKWARRGPSRDVN
ncbi:hypothetical protein GW17_00048886, partial [Ensete ventricosum]